MDCLIVFTKYPTAGKVKTRLCPPLTHDQAASLARAFIQDTWKTAGKLPRVDAILALDAGSDRDPDLTWLGTKPVSFFHQQGKDFGARLKHAFEYVFARGATKAILIGSDSPELSERDFKEAFNGLSRNDVVLGPAKDGGYYLIGCKVSSPFLFENITWSTEKVFKETVNQIKKKGLKWKTLSTKNDVDTFQDLKVLMDKAAKKPANRLKATRKLLRSLRKSALLSFSAISLCSVTGKTARAEEPGVYLVDNFSKETEVAGIPKGWQPLIFKDLPPSRYSIVQEKNNFFVKAVSSQSASGILKETKFNLKDYPILTWRWKVENIIAKGNASQKSGDDYPARVYVTFQYDPKKASFWEKAKYGTAKKLYGNYPPQGALNYIWDNKLPVGTAIDNAYTDRAKMIVIESGKKNVGQWVREERNVYEDYKKLFKREPPPVAFVAIMSDTDDTKESAVAYYDDVQFLKQ